MSTSPPLPAPLALGRIHRLLRPLRASLATLLSSLTLAESRLVPPRDGGKGKAREVDLDYANGNSSPFHSTLHQRKHKTSATYGTSKRGAVTAAAAAVGKEKQREESGPVDLRKSGLDEELVAKVGHLVKAFRNVLECAYGVDRRKSGADEPRDVTRVPSLVELMARRVGTDLEEVVGTDEEDSEGEMTTREEEEDVQRLVEEWYETVPPYTRRFAPLCGPDCSMIL